MSKVILKDLAPGLGSGWDDGIDREAGKGAAREKPPCLERVSHASSASDGEGHTGRKERP